MTSYFHQLTGYEPGIPPEYMPTYEERDPKLDAVAWASIKGPRDIGEVEEILASEDLCYHLRRLWAERSPSTELRTRILAEFGELGEKLLQLA